jgi:hypothetical protein
VWAGWKIDCGWWWDAGGVDGNLKKKKARQACGVFPPFMTSSDETSMVAQISYAYTVSSGPSPSAFLLLVDSRQLTSYYQQVRPIHPSFDRRSIWLGRFLGDDLLRQNVVMNVHAHRASLDPRSPAYGRRSSCCCSRWQVQAKRLTST